MSSAWATRRRNAGSRPASLRRRFTANQWAALPPRTRAAFRAAATRKALSDKRKKKPAKKKKVAKKAKPKAKPKKKVAKKVKPKPKPKKKVAKKKKPKKRRKPTMADRMQSALATMAKKSKFAHRDPITITNADGSIDSELRIPVPRGKEARAIIKKLSQVQRFRFNRDDPVWLAVGTRYSPDTIDPSARDEYNQWRGMLEVSSWYNRANYAGERFATALQAADQFKKHWRRKAAEVVVRLEWNPKLVSVTRPGEKKPGKRQRPKPSIKR